MAFGYEAELRAEIARLRLTDAERVSVKWAAQMIDDSGEYKWHAATLRGLLSRTGDCPAPDNAADRNNGTAASV